MKRIFIIPLLAIFCLYSCQDEKKKEIPASENAEENEAVATPDYDTYAEISIKEGGEWKGREYEGGTFKNVDSVQLPASHTDHSYYIRYEGPGWENSNVAYRLYLDWRNAIDIFGKKVDTLVLPYVGQDGFDSYHEEAPWGLDILKAGKSLGIGGFGRYMNDSVAHFRNVSSTIAEVKNTENSSAVELTYKDWETGEETIDLNAVLSIYPEGRYTKAELTPSQEIEGLATGIVKSEGIPLIKKERPEGEWAYIATYGAQTLVNDEDKLGMAIFYKTDEVQEQVEGPDDHLVVFEPTAETVTYYFLGAWDQEKDGIQDKETFIADLDSKLETLDQNDALE